MTAQRPSIRSSVFLGATPRVSSSEERSAEFAKLRIVVVGDFSGRRSRGLCDADSIERRPLVRIDPDEIEDAYRAIAPEVALPTPWDTTVPIRGGGRLRPRGAASARSSIRGPQRSRDRPQEGGARSMTFGRRSTHRQRAFPSHPPIRNPAPSSIRRSGDRGPARFDPGC